MYNFISPKKNIIKVKKYANYIKKIKKFKSDKNKIFKNRYEINTISQVQ